MEHALYRKKRVYRLLFEQSGTFKNALESLGETAIAYDIENQFGKTDVVVDLFEDIDNHYGYINQTTENPFYRGYETIFEFFEPDDVIIAFFPCTYFSIQNQIQFRQSCYNNRNKSYHEVIEHCMNRHNKRNEFYQTLLRFCDIVNRGGWKTIIENPATSYIREFFPADKFYIDNDRRQNGDLFCKPTMYATLNIEEDLSAMFWHAKNQSHQGVRNKSVYGIERSKITPDYAKWFCDKLLEIIE